MNFLRHLLITLMLAFPLVAITGCMGGSSFQSETQTPPGKVLIQYRVTNRDRSDPPKGFVVWRSDSELGPYERINPEPVPFILGQVGDDNLALLHVDSGLPMDGEFFYFIERVEKDGTRKTVAPPVRTKVMLPMTNRELSQWKSRSSKTPDKPRG